MSHPNNKVPKKEYIAMNKSQHDNIIRLNGEVIRLSEFIKNKLYFTTITNSKDPASFPGYHFFSIDDEFVYINYYNDFGPLNLAHLYRYCVKLRAKLNCPTMEKIIHYTSNNQQKRANAAFLIGSFAIIYLNKSPKEAYRALLNESGVPFKPFQDASLGTSAYQLRLLECLEGLHRAMQFNFVRFNDFCVEEFELYSKIDHGDMNWIIPQKFIAFCGPVSRPGPTNHRKPEDYFDYFLQNNVDVVIRLSKREYDAHSTFEMVGIKHYDLYYIDGGIPSVTILNRFLVICEETSGAVAVHCKAGLGRTGSLIGAYMMKHYRMKAKEVIAWMRICRPGSVIGKQQAWLEDLEEDLWAAGDIYRRKHHGDGDRMPFHKYGIYSIAEKISHSCDALNQNSGTPTNATPILRNRNTLRQERVERLKAGELSPIIKDGVASKNAYPCHPGKMVTAQALLPPVARLTKKVPTLYGTTRTAAPLVSNFVISSMAGTSAQQSTRTPSAGNMRYVNPHPLRSKKLAYVTGKIMAANNPKPKPKEEVTQGDKLRRVKYLKETSGNYANTATINR